MRRRGLVAGVVLALAPLADAGHGVSASFAAIEWLPDAGRTPDQWLYALDGWSERRELDRAAGPRETIEIALRIAREKLAELEAMIRAEDGAAAAVALARYVGHVDLAASTVARPSDGGVSTDLAARLCQELLEHQYILSVDYERLPAGARSILRDAVVAAARRYDEAARSLPRKDREAFAFKENEVRWSVRTGMRDDRPEPVGP